MFKKSSATVLLGTFIIVIIVIAFQRFGFLRPLNNIVTRIFSPVARLGYVVSHIFNQNSTSDLSNDDLRHRLEKIETENRSLINANAQLAEVQRENEQLRSLIQYHESSSRTVLAAQVIARGDIEEANHQQTITLDQGTKQGLVVGLPIIDSEGIVVGKITDTKDYIAEGCLLFENSCRFAVAIQGQGGTIGVIQSDLNLSLKIDFIPHDRRIEVGQIIVTSGLETGIPAGLVLGQVTDVIKEGNELWQHALVKPLGNFDTLQIVGVIK